MGYRVRSIENDDLPPDKLEEFLRNCLTNISEYSIPGAAIYVACPAGTPLPALIASFAGSGFEFRWGLVWVKDQIVLSRADYHFKHENILYGWKTGAAHYFTEDRTQSSVFEYPRPKSSEEHPTMKPIALIQHMIRNSSRIGDIIADVFGGSGSTMLACKNEGRNCRMIEKEPKYCAVILQRMTDAFPGIIIEKIDSV
jgi:DNA modification methylase